MNEYNSTNLIREPTIVTATSSSLIDVILTNRLRSFLTSGTFNLGLSDHHLAYVVSRSHCSRSCPINVERRTFKNYDPERFRKDLHSTPFDVALKTLTASTGLGVTCYVVFLTTTHQLNVKQQIVNTCHL